MPMSGTSICNPLNRGWGQQQPLAPEQGVLTKQVYLIFQPLSWLIF